MCVRNSLAALLQLNFLGMILSQDSFPMMVNPHKTPNSMGGGQGRNNARLGPTEILIDGTIFDVSNKFVQRVTAGGTSYFSYLNPGSQPVFMRREMDTRKRYVMFPDRSRPLGGGYFIILRRLNNVRIRGRNNEPVYEAYRLRITDYIQAWVRPYFSERVESAAGFSDSNMMLQAPRMKREDVEQFQDEFNYEDYGVPLNDNIDEPNYINEEGERPSSNSYDTDTNKTFEN